MVDAVLTLRRREYLWLAVALPSVMAVADIAVQYAVGAPVTRWTMEPVPGFFTPLLLVTWLCDAMMELARHRDDARLVRERAEADRATEESTSDARREAARLVHDHLLHALHAVAQTDRGVDVREAAAECDTAHAALTSHHAQEPAVSRLCALVADDPALVAAGAQVRGSAPALPTSAARAMADAAHEALNNVARHAHADEVVVEVEHEAQQWRCTIRDDGDGFDPERIARGHMGVRRSIVERLAEVGGRATVTSTLGRGTTVVLLWPALDDEPTGEPADDLDAHNATARAAWPSLIFAPVFTAILWPFVHPVWPVLVACAVLVLVGTLHIVRLRHHALTVADSVSLMTTSLTVWAVNLWCAPPVVHSVHHLWLGWGSAALAHLVVLQTRIRRGVIALAIWVVATTGLWMVRAHGHVDWAHAHAAITVGISEAVLALVVFHYALHFARESSRQRRLADTVLAQSRRVDARSQLEQYWSHRVTREAIPLLRLLADHPLAIDEQQRRHARLLEATLRDELLLGPGNATLLAALRTLRERDWTVTSSVPPDDAALATATMRLADDLGRAARPGQSLTLSSTDRRITAVVLAPSPAQAAHWQEGFEEVIVDDDFCRLVRTVTRCPRRGDVATP